MQFFRKKSNNAKATGGPAAPPAPQQRSGGHQRMSTEEQINLALKMSLDEAKEKGIPTDPEPPAPIQNLNKPRTSSHNRMNTAEQIQLAVQMSIKEQEKEKQRSSMSSQGSSNSTKPAGTSGGKHQRMSTAQAIEVAIAQSLEEQKKGPPGIPPANWDIDQVHSFIITMNDDYETYADNLKRNKVDGNKFMACAQPEDLRKYGITNRTDRDNIWTAFRNLQEERAPNSTKPKLGSLTENQPVRSQKKPQDSFGGVASLFGDTQDEDDEEPGMMSLFADPEPQTEPAAPGMASLFAEPAPQAKPAAKPAPKHAKPSFGGVADIFGGFDYEDQEPPAQMSFVNAPPQQTFASANTSENFQQRYYDAANKNDMYEQLIADLKDEIDQHKRKIQKLETTVEREKEARRDAEATCEELEKALEEEQTKDMEPEPKPEPIFEEEVETAATDWDFVSFSHDAKEDTGNTGALLHKRDPSYTGELAGLFDMDWNEEGSDELDENDEDAKQSTTTTKPKKKRDPSFSGVIDLFDEDELEEMGIGQKEPTFAPIVTTSAPLKHKRDPSYSGVKELFDEQSEEEDEIGQVELGMEEEDDGAAGKSEKHKRDPSYSGVKDMFLYDDEEETGTATGISGLFNDDGQGEQEQKIEDLENEVQSLKRQLIEAADAKDELEQAETKLQELTEQLAFKTELYESSREREISLEDENTQMRKEMSSKIMEAANSNNVDELLKQEMSDTRSKLERQNDTIKQLTDEIKDKEGQLFYMKNQLEDQRNRVDELEDQIAATEKEKETVLQKMKTYETTLNNRDGNNDAKLLLEERLKSQELEGKVQDLQGELTDTKDTLEQTTKSKFELLIQCSQEMNRLREELFKFVAATPKR